MLIQNAHPSREKHLCPHYTFFSWNAYAHTSGFSLLESADPRQTFREDVELYIADFKLPMTGFLLLDTFSRPQRGQKALPERYSYLHVKGP